MKAFGVLTGGVLLAAAVTYAVLPVVPVRTGYDLYRTFLDSRDRGLGVATMMLTDEGVVHSGMPFDELSSLPEILIEHDAIIPEALINPFTGEQMRFERTPGNFSARKVDGETFICFYDLDGREMRVKLLPPKQAPPEP